MPVSERCDGFNTSLSHLKEPTYRFIRLIFVFTPIVIDTTHGNSNQDEAEPDSVRFTEANEGAATRQIKTKENANTHWNERILV